MLWGFSYKMLCYPVAQNNFLNIMLLETFCVVAIDHELAIRVCNVFSAALLVRREIDYFSAS